MITKISRVLFSLLAATAVLSTGCGRDLDARPVSEMVSVTRATENFDTDLIYDAGENRINLFAACNETASFQIVVDAGEDGLENLRIKWSDLATANGATIPDDNIEAFISRPVRIEKYPPWYLRLAGEAPRPRDYYDALVPLKSQKQSPPLDLAPGERLVLWFDIKTPPDAPAGDYQGNIEITSHSPDLTRYSKKMGLRLKVYDFVLPETRPVAAVGGFNHADVFAKFITRNGKPYTPVIVDIEHPLAREGLGVIRQMMRLGHRHRLDLFETHLAPLIKRDSSGKTVLDWEDYDAVVTPYLSGGAFEDKLPVAAWPAPLREGWPDPRLHGGAGSEEYASYMAELTGQCGRHFSKLPQAEGKIFLWPYRGQADAEAYERFARLAGITKRAEVDMPVLCPLPLEPPEQTRWTAPPNLDELADMRVPPGHFLPPLKDKNRPAKKQPLTGTWLSCGKPPYVPSMSIVAPAADMRAMPWFAMKYKCRGIFLPEVIPPHHKWARPGETTPAADSCVSLFYPAGESDGKTVLPSIRLKRLRRGLQDAAYLWLLRQRGRAGIADAIINTMARYAGLDATADHYLDARLDGWVRDPRAWQLARRLMAEEIQAAIHPQGVSNEQLLATRVAWRQFDSRTHRLRAERIRSRLLPAGQDKNGFRAEIAIDLYNEHTRKVDAAVKIEELPPGWKGRQDVFRLPAVTPSERRTITLTAEGDNVPTEDGKMSIPISITTGTGRKQDLTAQAPFITCSPVKTPPKIDGRLDDWPMRGGNAAGNFKLIGKRGRKGDGLAERQTQAFVVCDEKNLYIAFRCEEPEMDKLHALPNNMVHYEQLTACGEDLVEVIFDPAMAAESAEDFRHLVVKSNGAVVAEKGVGCDPPLGATEPWGAKISVAVGKFDDFWTVEIRAPLEAFGERGGAKFWGINFTRYATQGGEASSWSGASRYFYHPDNLGTMQLVEENE